MKITIDFELDRHDYFDDEGRPPTADVTDAELLLHRALSDVKEFAFLTFDLVIEQLEKAVEEAK